MTSVPTRPTIGPEAGTALPAVSERFLGVASSVVRDLLALTQRPGVISFAGGLPAPELFDVDGARAAFETVFVAGGRAAMQYSTTEGNPALRAQVAEMYQARGLPTTAEQIVITTGSQQGLSLLAQSLVDPGAVVLVERPSYLAALQCFALAGARLVAVPSAGEGIDLEALDALARAHRPVALYTVPTFHNPTGRTLDGANRLGIVETAGRHGFRVLEDDPYQQLRYSGDPMPPMASLTDDPELVVCTGSLSKILAPGLRVGWVRTTSAIRAAVVVGKQAADLHTSTLDQAAAAAYLASGRLAPALDRARTAYRDRRDALLAGLPSALPAGSTWNTPDGGMFVWAHLPADMDAADWLPRALEHEVAYVPGAPFFPTEPERNSLRLSFTTYAPRQIIEGTRRLGAAFAD
jgi:DNA-binding transcriptional MocR family regulator